MSQSLKNISNRNSTSLDNVCILISAAENESEIASDVPIPPLEVEVFCAEMPATSNEHLTAGTYGFKAEKTLLVDSESYEQQGEVNYEGKGYTIYRTYSRADGFTELHIGESIGS